MWSKMIIEPPGTHSMGGGKRFILKQTILARKKSKLHFQIVTLKPTIKFGNFPNQV